MCDAVLKALLLPPYAGESARSDYVWEWCFTGVACRRRVSKFVLKAVEVRDASPRPHRRRPDAVAMMSAVAADVVAGHTCVQVAVFNIL